MVRAVFKKCNHHHIFHVYNLLIIICFYFSYEPSWSCSYIFIAFVLISIMNNVVKHVEHMQALLDIGAGLLNQLYYVKIKTVTNDAYDLVSDSIFAKVRAKLEKKFPLVPDFSKVCRQHQLLLLLNCCC